MVLETPEAIDIVNACNDCIANRDADCLAKLMTVDHTFVDTEGKLVSGRPACRQAWIEFFKSFPDYFNDFDEMVLHGNRVKIAGRSSCSDAHLDRPALWTAEIHGKLIAKWQVYDDTEANRKLLQLQPHR